MPKKNKSKRRRIDMEALPTGPKPIPDSFENVIKALVKPVEPKKEEGERRQGLGKPR